MAKIEMAIIKPVRKQFKGNKFIDFVLTELSISLETAFFYILDKSGISQHCKINQIFRFSIFYTRSNKKIISEFLSVPGTDQHFVGKQLKHFDETFCGLKKGN